MLVSVKLFTQKITAVVKMRITDTYKERAHAGDAVAQYNLGICYATGLDIPQDFNKAVEWWMKAAEQRIVQAQFNLASAYDNGHGVPQNHVKAAEWYAKASEQGFAPAQNNLGSLYLEGRGVPEDRDRAVELWKKAAEQGNESARKNLDILSIERKVCRYNGTIWWRMGKENVMVCCGEMLHALNWIRENGREVNWTVDTECPFCGGVSVKRDEERCDQ